MKVPFHQVEFGAEEIRAVINEMADNWFSPRGPRLEEFGKRWAAFVGRKYGWPVSSGTGAIHLALLGLGVGPGDVVAVPSYTCSPGVYPVTYAGATPLFIDCELETYGMDPGDLERKLDEHERVKGSVKAAIPVHLYGAGCQNQVLDVLRDHGVAVVEDCCESDGGLYRGGSVPLGCDGDIACFSFRGDKVLTALGTGGMFVTDNWEVFRKMKLYSDLGLKNDATAGRYRDLEVVGYNYEISNPAAAFGLAQIDRMPKIIEGRRRAAAAWRAAIADYARDEEFRPALMDDYPGHVWYQMPLRFPKLGGHEELDQLIERLLARGVSLIPPFWPMEKQPAYRHLGQDCPMSAYCAGHVLLFPCYPGLTEVQIGYMASVIAEEYARIAIRV